MIFWSPTCQAYHGLLRCHVIAKCLTSIFDTLFNTTENLTQHGGHSILNCYQKMSTALERAGI